MNGWVGLENKAKYNTGERNLTYLFDTEVLANSLVLYKFKECM